jgi:hypothetical protein
VERPIEASEHSVEGGARTPDTARRPDEAVTRSTFLSAPFGKPWEHWIVLGVALGGVAALVVLGVFVDPDPRGFGTHERLGLPACKPMEWWGVPCPGCGVTTSLALVAHGHPWSSIVNQPFGFAFAFVLVAFAAWALVQAFRGRDLSKAVNELRVGRLVMWLALLMAASWIYKLVLVRHWLG